MEGLALNIIGQGEGSESWQRLVLEYDPRSLVRAAGFIRKILSHPFTADSSSFEAFDATISMHERRTSKVINETVVSVVSKKMSLFLILPTRLISSSFCFFFFCVVDTKNPRNVC